MSRGALTLDEAAAELRKSARWLLEWLRKHPTDKAGEPYYTPVGRDKIFHQADIARIEGALRGELKCLSNSGRRAPVRRRTTKSGERSEDQRVHSALKRAAELLSDPTLSNSSSKSKIVSVSTDAGPRPKLRVIKGMTS
jgi:hypothetical protein